MSGIILSITPSNANGDLFEWRVDPSFRGSPPWTFQLRKSLSGGKGWRNHLDPVVDLFALSAPPEFSTNFDDRELYKVTLQSDDGLTLESEPRSPTADLPRREYLIGREVQRREVLAMRTMSGIPVSIWKAGSITEGGKCQHCVDPVTGGVSDPNCPYCDGTGKVAGYTGPYEAWGKISTKRFQKKMVGDSGQGGFDDNTFYSVRLIGRPRVIRGDILIDATRDDRFEVVSADSLFELRRVPFIFSVVVTELADGNVVSKLGTDLDPEARIC